LDTDRSDDYKLIPTKADEPTKNYKLYKVDNHSTSIETCLQKDKKNLVAESKPAKPKKGLFTKKPAGKKDSLATTLKKAGK